MNVTLPPLFRINCKEKGSSIQQLIAPSTTFEANVASYINGRLRGYSIIPTDGSAPFLLITNNSKPSGDVVYALRLKGLDVDPAARTLDLAAAKWTKYPNRHPVPADVDEYLANAAATRASWSDAFAYKKEDPEKGVQGLRPPQLGAIHAVQAHWSVDSDPGTIVLPTGVGKTETMLSLLVVEHLERLLVVVPTDALRTQISEKFLQLGILKNIGIVADFADFPVVGVLNHRPTNVGQVESFFRKCNVVVTTMPLASQCTPEVTRKMADLCGYLFIDEAHHVAAPTWKDFRDQFKESRIVQFTATPYRNDDQPIGGKRLFTFSLRHAQEQGYFKRIKFKPVIEFDPARKDAAIAEATVEQLRADAYLGHVVMARVASVARAEEVFEFYRKYPEFNPVQIHTGIKSKSERDRIRTDITSGRSRIVICVDMLGEGFDFPQLKIAAFHDIRKSFPVTLQLVGRFTRTETNLGDATIIANIADLDVKDELKKLYRHDTDWNVLLPLVDETIHAGEFSLWEFIGGFQELPDELTLRNVRPAMSTVVYRTTTSEWTPENFAAGIAGYKSLDKIYHTLNPQENTLVIVTARRIPVDWAEIDELHTWDWQLYVLHWDRDRNLLFIHNSSNSGFFKDLAKAVAGDVAQIRGPSVFRCLSGINRLKLQNVGLLEQLGRLIRYTMRAGSDVEPVISEAQRQKTIRANLFGQGFESGQRATIGCSYKGRIWSYRTANLLQLTAWCRTVGAKLVDDALDPEEVLRGTLVPQLVSVRPHKMPIAVDWPDLFYKESEQVFSFDIDGTTIYRYQADLVLIDPSTSGPLKFAVASNNVTAEFELKLIDDNGVSDYSIQSTGNLRATMRQRSRALDLAQFFESEPPTFWFADGSSLTGIEYVALRNQPEPFPRARIEAWDWAHTDIRVESQSLNRNPISIQYRVISEMKKRPFSVIFDDDDQGEAADVVGVFEAEDHIEVEFWHCKYASADTPGHRITELYEVCGQAQKSIRWLEKPRDLFTHLMRREPRRYAGQNATRYELGTEADLLRIREKAEIQPVRLRISIVQPGLSQREASQPQLELLAVTENYLLETFAVPFAVVASY